MNDESLSDLTARHAAQSRARAFVAYLQAFAGANGSRADAMARMHADRDLARHLPIVERAVQPALDTSSAGPAGPMAQLQQLAREFLALVARRSVLGQLRGLRRVPAHVRVPVVSEGSEAAWGLQANPIPASALGLNAVVLPVTFASTILVYAKEMAREGGDAFTTLLESDLTRAIIRLENSTLLSDAAAVDEQQPAGLLAGLSPTGAGSPESIESDVAELYRATRGAIDGAPYFICSADGALYLALQRDSGGTRIFPNIGITGGDLFGVPTIIAPEAADKLVCLDASTIVYSDLGLDFTLAQHAAIEMDDSPTAGGAALVSMFQANSIGLKALRYLHWIKGYDDSVQYLELPVTGSPA